MWSRKKFQSVLGSHCLISTINCYWNLKCGWFVSVKDEGRRKTEYRLRGNLVWKFWIFRIFLQEIWKACWVWGLSFVCLLLLAFLFVNGDANWIWVAVGSDSWCVQRLGLGKQHVEHLGTYGDHHHCNIATGPTPFSRTKQTNFANMVSVVFRPLQHPFPDLCCAPAPLPCSPNACSALLANTSSSQGDVAHTCLHVRVKGHKK